MLDAMVAGELKAMYIMGEDPVLTDADANHVRKAIASLDFLVVQDIFLTETAKYADVVLPAACYAEKDGTFTNTERRVQRVRKAVEPPGQARADWEIIADLSTRMGYPMRYDSAADIFEEIRTLTPTYAGMTYDRVDACGLQWPCPDLDHPGTPYLHEDTFPRGRGQAHGHRVRSARRAHQRGLPDPAHHRPHALPVQHLHPAVADPGFVRALRADRDQPGRRRRHRSVRRRRDAGHVATRLGGHQGDRSPTACRPGSCS